MKQYDTDTRKILSALCHAASLFSWTIVSLGLPIAILILSEDTIVKKNAKEALNYQITFFLYALVCVVLIFAVIGIPLLFALIILSLILPIIAIVRVASDPDVPYRYPFICRLF
ncbi:MAG: DUF4870 domain-containing protein [Hydrococcus sp. Prado102]|jgi:hypothetical protein|nr:DUF4870 domain-containing protein [Hydrococcus sp. Prado102]